MSLYDYPRYYDLVYGSDWKAEFDFLTGVFDKHVCGEIKQLLEPACGTGRLIFRLQVPEKARNLQPHPYKINSPSGQVIPDVVGVFTAPPAWLTWNGIVRLFDGQKRGMTGREDGQTGG